VRQPLTQLAQTTADPPPGTYRITRRFGGEERQQVSFQLRVFSRLWTLRSSFPHAIRRALGELSRQFPSPTLDRLGIYTSDVRHQLVTTMVQTIGLDGGIPPPLLFIQAGQQYVI
jgi:hypothetical protein